MADHAENDTTQDDEEVEGFAGIDTTSDIRPSKPSKPSKPAIKKAAIADLGAAPQFGIRENGIK